MIPFSKLKQRFSLWSKRRKHCQAAKLDLLSSFSPMTICPVCGGEMVEKEVEKLLRGGVNVAVVRVSAEVCQSCGERLFSQETVKRFEEIRNKLEEEKVEAFQPLGQSFQVA